MDTLRADHLGCYGYERQTSPQIDALARSGVLFERIYTSLPRTTQSIASIMTGRFPKNHGARGLFSHLAAENLTLAEILRERGFDTAAFVSNMFLRPGQGFEQGFMTYDNPASRWQEDSAAEITAAALGWLEQRRGDRPFFLWVHYLDPHWTYLPPAPFDTRFSEEGAGALEVYEKIEAGRLTKGEVIFENRMDSRQVERAVALYDGEIASVDSELRPLLERARSEPGNMLVVLTSDHGESLGEHDYYFAHGEYLYQPGLHIPLIISLPGKLPTGLRVESLGQNIDIAPTILTILGIPGLQGVDGRPLLTRAGGRDDGALFEPSPGRTKIFAESDFQLIHAENRRYYIPGPRGRWSAASDGRFKLIHVPRPSGEWIELYDLLEDPGERHPLTRQRGSLPEAVGDLLRALRRFVDYEAGVGPGIPGGISPEDQDRLRSLGYIN
jgi:arylsulfatase